MSFYKRGELVFEESRNFYSLYEKSSSWDLIMEIEKDIPMKSQTLVCGLVNQGAWAIEAICKCMDTEQINEIHIKEMKDHICCKEYSIPIYQWKSNSSTLFLWMDFELDPQLYYSFSKQLLEYISFESCILLDSFPFADRVQLPCTPQTIYQLTSTTPIPSIPILPPSTIVTKLGASLFSTVLMNHHDISSFICCPDQGFSVEPVLALCKVLLSLLSQEYKEEDLIDRIVQILKRKASVCAYNSIYM